MFLSQHTAVQRSNTVKIEGAVGASGANSRAATLKFVNFDSDVGTTVPLAEVEAADAYGDDRNGSGNLHLRTSADSVLSTVVTVTCGRRVGVNVLDPQHELDVAGDAAVSGDLTVERMYARDHLAVPCTRIVSASTTSTNASLLCTVLWRRGDRAPTGVTVAWFASASNIGSAFRVYEPARNVNLGQLTDVDSVGNGSPRFVRIPLTNTVYTPASSEAYAIEIVWARVGGGGLLFPPSLNYYGLLWSFD